MSPNMPQTLLRPNQLPVRFDVEGALCPLQTCQQFPGKSPKYRASEAPGELRAFILLSSSMLYNVLH